MNWNHRLIDITDDNNGEQLYVLKEVYYDDNDKPIGSCDPSMMSETLDGMKELIERLREATTLPILNPEDFKKGETK